MGGTMMSGQQELYACLYAQEFPAQALLRLRPELRQKAVAVIHPSNQRLPGTPGMEGEPPLQTVCALNAQARRLGIARGMTRVEVETFASLQCCRVRLRKRLPHERRCWNVRELFLRGLRIYAPGAIAASFYA